MRLAFLHSLRTKVVLLVAAVTFLALLLSGAGMVFYELRTLQRTLTLDLEGEAEVMALASAAALAFNDPENAQQTLQSLRARPQIVAAALYLEDGRLFATYARSSAEPFPVKPAESSLSIQGNDIRIQKPVSDRAGRLGTVYLHGVFDLGDRLVRYLAILGAVMVASLAVAALLGLWLQRLITRPVFSVADVARRVMEQQDFSLRAPRITHDELAVLADDFNAMLARIEANAMELQSSNRRLQEEVAERFAAEEALRAADRRKDEFLAMLGHELRNPLAAIGTALEVTKSARVTPEVAGHARNVIGRQVGHLVRLVDDLLDVSRVMTGKIVLDRSTLEFAQAIENALEGMGSSGRLAGRDVRLSLETVWIDADPTRIEQVITNLVGNALKYSPAGSPVALSLSVRSGRAVLSVSDEGIGIEAELLPKVFDLFVQGERSLDRAGGGLGIGLTLVKRLVEMHDGVVSATSAGPGRGSTFVVDLPAFVPPAPTSRDSRRREARSRPLRLLIVEDNADARSMLEQLLQLLGHEVLTASDGESGYRIALDQKPRAALIDIGLPGLDGFEVASRIRAVMDSQAIFLVAVSGYGDDHHRERAMKSGFDRHLRKPVDIDVLVEMLESLKP